MKRILIPVLLFPLMLLFLYSAKPDEVRSYPFTSNSDFITDAKADDSCSMCHADLLEKKSKHSPALDNGCVTCHQSNGKTHPGDSTGFTLADKVPQLCYMCHDAVSNDLTKMTVVHGAVTQKKFCINCHSPHSADNEKLLISEEKELCLGCHNKTIVSGTKKLANIKQQLKNSTVIHPAIEGGCIVCHKPHASDNNYLLIKSFPSGNYVPAVVDSFALCFDCHDKGLLTDKTTTITSFRKGEENLHYLHMNGEKARSCAMCHEIHASMNEHLIRDEVVFGKWIFKMNYKPDETGGSCLPGCHGEKKYMR